MLFKNPRLLLSEAAAYIDPEVSEEVKDVIEDLDDTLSNNIEEVEDEDKTTNGGIPVTTESCSILEASGTYNRGKVKYLVSLESVIAIKEAEGEAIAAAEAEPGKAPTEEEIADAEPDACNVVEKIAADNGVDPEQVAVVITAENARFLAEMAIYEAKCGKTGNKAKAAKKIKKMKDTTDELKGTVKLVKA